MRNCLAGAFIALLSACAYHWVSYLSPPTSGCLMTFMHPSYTAVRDPELAHARYTLELYQDRMAHAPTGAILLMPYLP